MGYELSDVHHPSLFFTKNKNFKSVLGAKPDNATIAIVRA
jgi:hypothetical protein